MSRLALRTLLVSVALALLPAAGASAGSPQQLDFADWTATGDNSATGTIAGRAVSLTGTSVSPAGVGSTIDGSATWFSDPYFTPPLPQSDAIAFYGQNGFSYTLQFGAPTADPVLHLYSLASDLEFPPGTQITRVSGEDGFEVSGNVVHGELDQSLDTGGTVRIAGTHQSLTFTATPTFEDGNNPDGIYIQAGAAIPPDTTITDGPTGAVWDANVSFGFSSTIPGSTFECQMDSFGFAPCSTPYLPGIVPVGAHTFAVRAVSPRGVTDATPATRDFAINGPQTFGEDCRVKPFVFPGSVLSILGERDPSACDIARQPTRCPVPPGFYGTDGCEARGFCWLFDVCKWRELPCPVGARCKVVVRNAWFDADDGVNWKPFAMAGFAEYDRDFNTATYKTCRTGPDGDRCVATASAGILGDGRPARGRCGLEFYSFSGAPYGLVNPGQLGSQDVRRIECSMEVSLQPAEALAMAASGQTVEVYAPNAGLIFVIGTIGLTVPSSADVDAARRRKPRIAPVRKTVAKRGPVKLKLKLNKPAKRRLRRRGKLKVKLTVRFTGTDGKKLARTQRLKLIRPPSKRTLCAALPQLVRKQDRPAKRRKRCPR